VAQYILSVNQLQKPPVEDGPSPEEIKQREIAEAAAKAWEEATAKSSANITSLMKIEEVLSMGL
jgi:hypothetical protein